MPFGYSCRRAASMPRPFMPCGYSGSSRQNLRCSARQTGEKCYCVTSVSKLHHEKHDIFSIAFLLVFAGELLFRLTGCFLQQCESLSRCFKLIDHSASCPPHHRRSQNAGLLLTTFADLSANVTITSRNAVGRPLPSRTQLM